MLRTSLLYFPSAGVSFYHNSTPFSKPFGEQARAPGWGAGLGAGPPRERQLGARSCEDVSGETGRTTSRAASRSSEFRGCLRRNGPDHLSRGISELRVARMSQAKRAGPPRKQHRGAQNCEDVSGETGRTTSRAASQIRELRGRPRRDCQDHLASTSES